MGQDFTYEQTSISRDDRYIYMSNSVRELILHTRLTYNLFILSTVKVQCSISQLLINPK